MNLTQKFFPFRYLVFLLSLMLLIGCNPQVPEPTSSIQPSATLDSISPETQTPTIEAPTPTIIPSQSRVILVAPPESGLDQIEELTATLSELAEAEDMEFEVRSSFSPQDLSPNLRLLVGVPPDPGLADLALAAPGTQFLGIAIPELQPAPNLTVIDTQEIDPGRIGFLAGYLAAVVTPEWRVGVISSNDTTAGVAQRQGFINGAIFFCGLCRQTYPPFESYPMYVEAPSASNPQEWLAVGDILIDKAVKTVYIPPGVGDESLLEHFAEAGINLIGTAPPPLGIEEQWIATITGDISSALRSAWPELIAGQSGISVQAPLILTHINPDLFSPGRQRLVGNLISELSNGYIDIGVE